MLLLSTGARAELEVNSCDGTLQAQQVAQLLFGRNVEDRARVSEADFHGFVAREVSPRFPEGFTVIDATGQWRDARRGTIVHEAAKIIEIVLPAGEDNPPEDRGDRRGLQAAIPAAIGRADRGTRLRALLAARRPCFP